MPNTFKKLAAKYWLIGGIAFVIGLAYVIPEVGVFLKGHHAVNVAIIAIFLMSGMTTRLSHVGEDMANWRCHALIQGLSFVLIPAILLATSWWIKDESLKYGVFLVAVVPTTISSCVVMTTAAGGRTSCALLNAAGGNLLGIVISPLLLGFLVGRSGAVGVDSSVRTIVKLCWLVLLPFVAGQVSAQFLPQAINAGVKRIQSRVAQCFILVIMFCAFAESMNKLGEAVGGMWMCFAYLAVLHLVLTWVAAACARGLRLSPTDPVAAVYCGTQKTLAMGLPLAYAFFEGSDVTVGLVILPLTFYHLFQLVYGGMKISYWSKRTAAAAA